MADALEAVLLSGGVLLDDGGVVVLLVLDGVWLLTGGLLVEELVEEFTSLCGMVELWVELEVVSGGVVVLDELLLVELPLGEVAVLLELVLGGSLVLGDVLVLGGCVVLLGLFTSPCGMVPVVPLVPVPVQSDEIIFTLLTLRAFELEDEGLVLPVAVPAALPLGEVVPVTWIRCPT